METSCGVVLVNYGTVLLLQYPQGHWDFPKGHVEEDDPDHHATAARELTEETGIDKIQFVEGFVRAHGPPGAKRRLWLLDVPRVRLRHLPRSRGHEGLS